MEGFITKKQKNFSYYSRGYLYETKIWITKVKNRRLISEHDLLIFKEEIIFIGKILNNHIKFIGKYQTKDSNQKNEPGIDYIKNNDDIL